MENSFSGIDTSALIDGKKIVLISSIDFFTEISTFEAKVTTEGFFKVLYPHSYTNKDMEPESLVGKEVTLYSVSLDKEENVNIILNRKVTINKCFNEVSIITYNFSSEEIM